EAVLRNLRYQSELADGMYADALAAAKQAIKVAPDFAWGWAAMANLRLDGFALVAKDGAKDASEQALWCIQRALKADPASATRTGRWDSITSCTDGPTRQFAPRSSL